MNHPQTGGAPRTVARLVRAVRMLEGEGFEVRRPIPSRGLEAVGPFIFLDHLGPIDMAPGEAKGAPSHPHCGFETLTYLLEGGGEHRDSLGHQSVIGPLEAQWMRAGSGILHDEGADEQLRRDGGRLHGAQFWINLPKGRKMSPPAYRHIARCAIPEQRIDDAVVRLLAGTLGDATGPVETFANPWLAHTRLQAGGRAVIDPVAAELGVYVAQGKLTVGADRRPVAAGELALLEGDGALSLSADADADAFILGGDPLDAPVRRYGPFVMSSDEELRAAVRDFQAGQFGSIPALDRPSHGPARDAAVEVG